MSGFNLADYEPVEDRIRAFWSDNPAGRINTELVKDDAGEYIMLAEVFRDFQSSSADATGYAHEDVAQLPGNMKASALEVCETSAIGRALANLGYAAKGKRPSREEMSKVSGGVVHGEGAAPPETPSGPSGAKAGADKGHGLSEAPPVGGAVSPSAPVPDDAGVGSADVTASAEPPAPGSNHVHDWKDKRADGGPLRAGWLSCECGLAKPGRKGAA